MKEKNFKFRNIQIVFILTFIFFASITSAQPTKYNKELLQKRNQQIRDEINRLNIELSQLKKESKSTFEYYSKLNEKIALRNKILSNTNKEKRFLEDDIYLKQLEINKLKRELDILRDQYAQVLIKAYKNKSVQNKLLFVLTSKDLSQALRRLKYLELYGQFQKKKTNEILEKKQKIESAIEVRELRKQEKEKLLVQQEKELKELESDKKEKEKIVNQYKAKEKEIIASIKKKDAERKQLERQIELAIKEELALEAKRRKEEQKRLAAEKLAASKSSSSASPTDIKSKTERKSKKLFKEVEKDFRTAEETDALSANFEANRKRLPWPVESGKVFSQYGKHPHPIYEGIIIEKTGIDFLVPKNSNARAVFDGDVFQIQSIPGGNKAVFVSHGKFFTIYNNLEAVFVKKGDRIKAKQPIGRIYTDEDDNTILDFQVWRGTKHENPALYLSGM